MPEVSRFYGIVIRMFFREHGPPHFHLAPDFQRSGDIWPRETQSRLIGSILLRIPPPVFYIAAAPDDNRQVVDGLQEARHATPFILDKRLRLRGLEYRSQFEAHGYDRLARAMQRRNHRDPAVLPGHRSRHSAGGYVQRLQALGPHSRVGIRDVEPVAYGGR